MKNNVDKRIVKTKHAIRSAFRELVAQKEMAEISISELTKRANITRSTFYMYYDSVGAVRDEIENEILEHLDQILSERNITSTMKDPYPMLDALSHEITKYDEYNRYIVCSKNSGQLLENLKQHVVEILVTQLEQDAPTEELSFAKYIATFLAAGIIDTYKVWYNHQSSMSLEELCKHFSDIILQSEGIILPKKSSDSAD